MTTNDILSNLQLYFDKKFDILEEKINLIHNKCEEIETKMNNITNIGDGCGGGTGDGSGSTGGSAGGGNITLINTLTSGEETIKHLNSLTNYDVQEDIKYAIENNCEIKSECIYSIIKSNLSIYEYIIELLYEIENNSNSKYIIALPSSKNVLYYWNHEKKSWIKLTKQYLKVIFEAMQLKIIYKYQHMLNDDFTLKQNCVENGDLIYINNFEKKSNEFKKDLFSKFI
tara:strand:+ start:4017 stop:4700 length:684 start_codon:yes stop_codon:yes gene_type:complete